MTIIPKTIQEYLEMIETENEHLMCNEQKLLAKLIRKIFAEEDLVCDEDRFNKYMTYQKYFPFKLLAWEKFIFYLHTCVFKQNGQPRFSDMFVLVGRGSGKNGYLSFLAFCLVTETNGIQEYDIDISANSEEQAKVSFVDIWNILENPKWKDKMKKNFRWNREEIVNKKTNSKIKYRTNSPKGKDGLRSAMVCFDECHVYTNYDNINVFTTGLGKKPCPRKIYITTNGEVRGSVLDDLLDKSLNILNGELNDNGFIPFICRLDKEEEVHKEENWFKANPSLYANEGLLEQIRKEYADYSLNPIINHSFLDKRMNLPKYYGDTALTSWDNIKATNQPIPYEELKGCECVVGLDYSKINDMVGVGILIRKNRKYYFIGHAFMCKNSTDLDRIKAPLGDWERMGLLTFVDGVEIDINIVMDWIKEQLEIYHFNAIGLDNFRYTLVKKGLETINIDDDEIKLVRPSDEIKIVPVIDSLFNNHKIVVGDNPLFRWSCSNTCLVDRKNGNFKYDKVERKSRKNDLFMAFVHAVIASQDTLDDWDDYDFDFKPFIF